MTVGWRSCEMIVDNNNIIKTTGRLELTSENCFKFPTLAYANNPGDKIKAWVEMRIYPNFRFPKIENAERAKKDTRCQIIFFEKEFGKEKRAVGLFEKRLSDEQYDLLWKARE